MTGNQIVGALKSHCGKVQVQALLGADIVYVYADKRDLLLYYTNVGDTEIDVRLVVQNGDVFIDSSNL